MKTSLVLTTINHLNKNLKNLDQLCLKHGWALIIIGDKKTPKNFKLKHGKFLSLYEQIVSDFKFAKVCPINNYARKNLGYLLSVQVGNQMIVETDDDNFPKKNFFQKRNLFHKSFKILDSSWVNIYRPFLKNKKPFIWPRGLPLDEINKDLKISKISSRKKKFLLQQGVCDLNPDVDAIYRMYKKKINIKFLNMKVNLNKSLSPFNSQNTTWHKSLLPLMYLPVTCSMRCTDIWRSLIVLKIMRENGFNILFHGPNMYQDRNQHNLESDFFQEVPMYINNKHIYKLIDKIPIKRGRKNFFDNLFKIYKVLINNKFFHKSEMKYLTAWYIDCKKIPS